MPHGSWLGLSSLGSSTLRALEWELGEVVRVLEVRSPFLWVWQSLQDSSVKNHF